jgi:hypothetical protein
MTDKDISGVENVTVDLVMTDKEWKVLWAVNAHQGIYDWSSLRDIEHDSGIAGKALGGVVSSLVQKGRLRVRQNGEEVLLTADGMKAIRADPRSNDVDQDPTLDEDPT